MVSARIVAASSGDALVAVRETASDVSELPETVDRVSAQLRERVGESLRTIQGDQPLEEVTTRSFQALEKYAQADRANNLGDTQRALALLEEAVADDSTFAMAYRKIGILLNNEGVDTERASEAFSRANALRDRLTDRERWLAEAAYLDYVEGDGPAAMDRYETVLEAYPTDRIALNNLAVAYRNVARPEDAAELYLRSIDAGGAPATTFDGVIPLLYSFGDTAEAQARARPVRADALGEAPVWVAARLSLLSAVFDYQGAEEAAEGVIEQVRGTPAEGEVVLSLAQIQLVRGRFREAWTNFERGIELLELEGRSIGISPGVAEALITGGVVRGLPGPAGRIGPRDGRDPRPTRCDRGAVVAAAGPAAGRELCARRAPGSGAGVPRGVGARQRRLAGGKSCSSGARSPSPRGAERRRYSSCARGGRRPPTAGCAGSPTSEERSMPSSSPIPRSTTSRRTSRPATSTGSANADNIMFWYVVPRLGELQAEHGDPERARGLFRLFLEATEGADPEYQPKRERVRARLEALGG